MVWSWTVVRFLFWVADFAFVFYISMELFVLIYEIIDNSGTAIILYNLVLPFNDLSIAFFVSGVDIRSAIRIIIVDVIAKYVWFRMVIRFFVMWSMVWGRVWGMIRGRFWDMVNRGWMGNWGMVRCWSWGVVRSWSWGMVWSWSRGMVWSWGMVWCWLVWQLVSYNSCSNH